MIMKLVERGKHQSTDNMKIGIKVESSYQEMKRSPDKNKKHIKEHTKD